MAVLKPAVEVVAVGVKPNDSLLDIVDEVVVTPKSAVKSQTSTIITPAVNAQQPAKPKRPAQSSGLLSSASYAA